jgi:hypothetical protein
MSTVDILIAIAIYLIVPLSGVGIYLLLVRKMFGHKIPNPPIVEWFVIFAIYGAIILITLTSLFWVWSGAATLGTLFLVFIAPILMAAIGYRIRKRKGLSKYHKWAYSLSLIYLASLPLAGIIIYQFV